MDESLLRGESEPTIKDQAKRCCGKALGGCGLGLLVLFVLAWILQFIILEFTTAAFGCNESKLEGYKYPGGQKSAAGGPEFNIVPRISLLVARDPMWYGEAFDVIPSNSASGVTGAPVGTWWRTWGPLFWTYTYEDVAESRTTMYMRRNLLRLGQSHKIVRCDGEGPLVTFTEGSNFFANRLRSWMGINQAMTYKVFMDNEMKAIAQETGSGKSTAFQSLTLRDSKSGDKLASSVLQSRHFHGKYDEWLVHDSFNTTLPYYVSSSASLLFAFFEKHHEPSKTAAQPEPQFLASSKETEEDASAPSTVDIDKIASAEMVATAESKQVESVVVAPIDAAAKDSSVGMSPLVGDEQAPAENHV